MFGGILNATPQSSVTTENIKTQKDVIIVKTLNGYFTDIRDEIFDNNGIITHKIKRGKAGKNRNIRVALARIDAAVSKRFGITTKSLDNSKTPMAVQTTPPNVVTTLSGDVPKRHAAISEYLKEHGTDTNVEHKDIDARTADWLTILKAGKTSIDAIDRQLEASSITVDLVNAKIYGYPKSATTVVVMDLVWLFDTAKLTPEEVTACFLHEIGHEFTHLEYSYNSVKNLRILVDSLISEVGNNGRAPLDALKISYGKITDDGDLDDTKTIPTAVLGITSKFLDSARLYGGNTYAGKDSERLADQFAVRFGVGNELTTALDKFTDIAAGKTLGSFIVSMGKPVLVWWVLTTVMFILCPVIGLMTILLGAVVLSAIGYIALVGYIFYVLASAIGGLLDRGIDTNMPYDSPKRRVLRMRNELIRQIRNDGLGKDAETGMLASLDLMESVAVKLSDHDEGVYYRIIGKFFSYSSDQNELRSIDNAIDDLTNNELHVAAAKLASVKGA